MLILGIESSCDETAAAVVKNGNEILSSVISSQIASHRKFGGVVPELASREHLDKIDEVVEKALADADVKIDGIDAIAVTQGPGLVGSLLVGVCYAKALAMTAKKPIIGVNHIEGHVFSVAFENPPVEYPALALIVSGGHTNLFLINEPGSYQIVSRTRDDAAGEAFDKVAKMLGLGYPGGPEIEKAALNGDAEKIKFSLPKISDGKPDFSFSGLKTAVSRYISETGFDPASADEEQIADIAASFQATVVRALLKVVEKVSAETEPKTLIIAGGVACNSALQKHGNLLGQKLNIPVYFPSKHLSTDNAAMIAAAGAFHLGKGETSDEKMTADVTLRLQNKFDEASEPVRGKVRYRL